MLEQVRAIPISRPYIGEEERRAVLEVLDSGMLAMGPRVAALESAVAEMAGVRHAIATSSGTTALHLALLALGVGPGDEVITSPFTFVASVNAILFCGAKPVFADIDPVTFNIDPGRIEAALSKRTKVLMPVHLYGQPADMDAITAIAKRRGILILEDAAQAIGARFKGREIGSFGTACFSLYATKNVMSAEGGIVTTDDDEIADQVRLLRNHGMRKRYYYEGLGYNFRMTDIHAAIAQAQLARMPDTTRRRRDNARKLTAGLRGVVTPTITEGAEHVWHQYTVRVEGGRRDEFARRLGELGVGTGIFYPQGVHRFPHVAAAAGEHDFPITDAAAASVLSLPVHPLVDDVDLDYIIEAVNSL
jgi:perosamine synthetase